MTRIPAPRRAAALALALASLAACYDGSGGPVGVNVVLIDRSGSIAPEDRAIYARSIDNIGAGIDAGGRVLVAEIGDADRSHFRALLDVRAQDSNARLDREDNLSKARAEISAALPRLLPEVGGAAASSTRILDAIAAVSEVFRPASGERSRLFVLSDGIEEGPVVNLARLQGGDGAIMQALGRARAEGLLPDLRGVEIHVIGAGGDGTAIGVKGVKAFWEAYAAATGAHFIRIGRLPHDAS